MSLPNVESSVFVGGPYLVRDAEISGSTLALVSDLP